MNPDNPYATVEPTPQTLHSENDLSAAPPMPNGDSASASAGLITRVVRGAHDTIDRLAESATPQLAHLERGLSQAGDALHDKTDLLRATGDEWAESLRSSVRDRAALPMIWIRTALPRSSFWCCGKRRSNARCSCAKCWSRITA